MDRLSIQPVCVLVYVGVYCTDACIFACMYVCMYVCTCIRMGVLVCTRVTRPKTYIQTEEPRIGLRIGRWKKIDGWMDGWMDGQKDIYTNRAYIAFCRCKRTTSTLSPIKLNLTHLCYSSSLLFQSRLILTDLIGFLHY